MAKKLRKAGASTKTSRPARPPAKSAKAAKADKPAGLARGAIPVVPPPPPPRPARRSTGIQWENPPRRPTPIPLHEKTFPNESPAYRSARNRLLEQEIALRRNIERIATQRRGLPLGGKVPEDYEFQESLENLPFAGPVRLSELFGDKPALIIYSFMYGPKMAQPCPSCTSILDGLDGQAPHIAQRVAFAVVAKSPADRIRAFAAERGWRNLRIVSSESNTYNRDYHGEDEDGEQLPVLNVFVKKGADIHHTYATEMMFSHPDPGQDSRHVDLIWPLWNMFDFTPLGRGEKWRPKLKYD